LFKKVLKANCFIGNKIEFIPAGDMGWLCCLDLSFEFNSDTDLRRDRHRLSNRFSHGNRINSGAQSIVEDVLLEDMCEIADIEYEGDPTQMNIKDKNKMLTRLSKNPQTEQYFRDEKALSQFFDNRVTLELPVLNKMTAKNESFSRVSLGIDSRLESRYSKISRNASRISAQSRISGTSRISAAKINQQIGIRSSNLQFHQKSQHSNHSYEGEKNHKRSSKTYDMANDIIKKRNSTSRPSGRFSGIPNIFNMNNSIYTERDDRKFGRDVGLGHNSDQSITINNLDDLRKVRKSRKASEKSNSRKSSSQTRISHHNQHH
jgi:hypothetical protein